MADTRTELLPDLRRALSKLQQARPLGIARVPNGFKGIHGSIPRLDGHALVGMKLARIDYSGRYPRLKITRQGSAALDRTKEKDQADGQAL